MTLKSFLPNFALILIATAAGSNAMAYDYLTTVCTPAISKAVLRLAKKSDVPSMSDILPWDKKSDQQTNSYTGIFEASVALEARECYDAYEVTTKVEQREGAKTPSCKVIKVVYKQRDCA